MAVQVDITKESVAVFVDLSAGESLTYRVTAQGPRPIFTLVDSQTKKLLMSNKDAPVQIMPSVVFERRWPLITDRKQPTSHTMGFQFLDLPPPAPPMSYRYEVEKNIPGGPTESVIDITYTSNERESFFQHLQVNTFAG